MKILSILPGDRRESFTVISEEDSRIRVQSFIGNEELEEFLNNTREEKTMAECTVPVTAPISGFYGHGLNNGFNNNGFDNHVPQLLTANIVDSLMQQIAARDLTRDVANGQCDASKAHGEIIAAIAKSEGENERRFSEQLRFIVGENDKTRDRIDEVERRRIDQELADLKLQLRLATQCGCGCGSSTEVSK